jgi:hypothetical protein
MRFKANIEQLPSTGYVIEHPASRISCQQKNNNHWLKLSEENLQSLDETK